MRIRYIEIECILQSKTEKENFHGYSSVTMNGVHILCHNVSELITTQNPIAKTLI